MKNLVAMVVFCMAFYCRNGYAQPKTDWSKQQNIAADLVLKLPEVIKADKQCRRLSKGKRHLLCYVDSDPSPGDKYFEVKVAEDNGMAYHTWFIFEVQQATKNIFYYDRNTGNYISLGSWRKNPGAYL